LKNTLLVQECPRPAVWTCCAHIGRLSVQALLAVGPTAIDEAPNDAEGIVAQITEANSKEPIVCGDAGAEDVGKTVYTRLVHAAVAEFVASLLGTTNTYVPRRRGEG